MTITGCGFTGALAVSFDGKNATFTVNSDTQITATSPAHAAGTVDINVTTPSGTSPSTSADHFTYGSCATVTITASPPSPSPSGTAITFTASATGCPNPQFKFFWSPPGGGWFLVQDWDGSSWTWDSTGSAAGTYRVDVWARQVGSSDAYQAFAVTSYTLTAAPQCTGAGVVTNPNSPQPVGTTVLITGTDSSGCPNPQFRFFIQDTNGNWTMVQDYDGPNYSWNTVGLPGGTYHIDVWVRETGSSAAYESFVNVPYTLNGNNCTSDSVSFDKASPQQTGTIITLTGSATGCPSPQFKFWIQPPGGGWMLARDWGGATFAWNTAGLAAGTYKIQVWARNSGSSAAYEAFLASPATYTLIAAVPCTAGTYVADKPSPQAHGTTITFTASAVGCSQPLYRWWVQLPNGNWMIVQDYSTNNVFVWNTTGLAAGTYRVNVWIQQNGSTTSPETFFNQPYTLT